jgi:Na+/H+ antiporter NhaD/arsenite permease-like protein
MLQGVLLGGIDTLGTSNVAFLQFAAATFLSATLDNNVVADFAARALIGLRIDWMHFFAMAQIAGYALGGCWTHIGSAQSVVAFAFIHREIDERFTPFDWIRLMTPVLATLFVLLGAIVYVEGLFIE